MGSGQPSPCGACSWGYWRGGWAPAGRIGLCRRLSDLPAGPASRFLPVSAPAFETADGVLRARRQNRWQRLGKTLGTARIVVEKPGGAGSMVSLGRARLALLPHDGYNAVPMSDGCQQINPSPHRQSANSNFISEKREKTPFAPVALVASFFRHVLVAHPRSEHAQRPPKLGGTRQVKSRDPVFGSGGIGDRRPPVGPEAVQRAPVGVQGPRQHLLIRGQARTKKEEAAERGSAHRAHQSHVPRSPLDIAPLPQHQPKRAKPSR